MEEGLSRSRVQLPVQNESEAVYYEERIQIYFKSALIWLHSCCCDQARKPLAIAA